jgi:hypothetical protein
MAAREACELAIQLGQGIAQLGGAVVVPVATCVVDARVGRSGSPNQ